VVFYGIQNKTGLVHGEATEKEFFLKLKWQNNNTDNEYELNTNLIGDYNIENVLAATTVGCYFSIDEEKINNAISKYTPSNNRSQYLKTEHNEVLLDAYNANPSSMQKALDNFKNIDGSKKALILGSMKELGEELENEHKALLEKLKTVGASKFFLVGEEFSLNLSLLPEAQHFSDVEELINHLKNQTLTGYKILVKGSRSNHLEKGITYL